MRAFTQPIDPTANGGLVLFQKTDDRQEHYTCGITIPGPGQRNDRPRIRNDNS
ncbi:hypothetical protein [Streptomyces sp. WAC 01325]|uniref:hypothetical protein n=1 Tax=Streptomyces sp. WAC 01325 TaxID=2203202 RepID=UPI00163BB314|nr:hypothetical protein [Streptomyces sp. WAC 01325]